MVKAGTGGTPPGASSTAQAAAEPDDRSNSPDDQAAGLRGDRGLHQQAVAVYR
jgi:hypothetical protein